MRSLQSGAGITITLLLLLSSSLTAQTIAFDEIDRVIEQKIHAHLVPGIAVVVMRGEEVIHTFTRDTVNGAPITPDTPFSPRGNGAGGATGWGTHLLESELSGVRRAGGTGQRPAIRRLPGYE
jgi:hypothetical protein